MPITVGTLGRLRAVDQRGRDIVFSFESSDLVLTPLLPNVVRHTWVPTHWRLYTGRVTDSYAVPRRDWPAEPAVTLTETPETVRVQLGELLIEATRDPFQLRYAAAADGRVFLQETEEGGLSWSYWEYALRYRLAAEDHFYGMGQANQLTERIDLDHRGHLREVWNQHSPPAATIFPALLSLRTIQAADAPGSTADLLLPRPRRGAAILRLLRARPAAPVALLSGAERGSPPSATLGVWVVTVPLWLPQPRGTGSDCPDLPGQGAAV